MATVAVAVSEKKIDAGLIEWAAGRRFFPKLAQSPIPSRGHDSIGAMAAYGDL
jgi:hypothetical protein